MKKQIILLTLIALFGCINKQKDIKAAGDRIINAESEEKKDLITRDFSKDSIENEAYHNKIFQEAVSNLNFDNTDCIQDFDTFFEKFSTDSVFQKKWVLFPLKKSYYGGHYYEDLIIEYIDSSTYKFRDFTQDKYSEDKEFSKYSVHVEKLDSIVNYSWYGIDNGIMIHHVFKKINNCWFLIAIEDEGI